VAVTVHGAGSHVVVVVVADVVDAAQVVPAVPVVVAVGNLRLLISRRYCGAARTK